MALTLPASFVAKTYTAGSDTINVTWAGAAGPVTLQLMGGNIDHLIITQVIASGLPLSESYYLYVPPVTIRDGNYTFEILDTTGQTNFEKPFNITSGAPATTSCSPSQTSSLASPSASSTLSPSASSPSTSNTSKPHNGLSTGDKAAIGVGSALGAVIIAVLIWLAWLHGKRSAKNNEKLLSEQSPTSPSHGALTNSYPPSYTPDTARAKSPEFRAGEPRGETIASMVGTTGPLSEDEKKELQSRRRAAELEGSAQKVVPGVVSERAELEARRKGASWETSELSF